MKDIRLKVYIDDNGVERVAVGLPALNARIGVVAMHDELPAIMFTLSFEEWNKLPHHLFRNMGPSEKTEHKHKI